MKLPMHFLYCYGYLAATVAWAMLSAPFYSPARSLVRRLAGATGWPGSRTALPKCALGDLTALSDPVRVDNSVDHAFNTSFYELFVLSQLVADRKPARVFEFGTFNGRTTLHLAANTPAETQITTIDLPEWESPFENHAIVGSCYRETVYADRIEQLYANTRRCDLSAYFGKMNFIFIDASHEYDDVCHDTDLAMQLACPDNCMILWHDYTQWPDVQQAVDERYASGGVYAGLQHIRGTTMAVLTMGTDTRSQKANRAASPPSRTSGDEDAHMGTG